nr:hypothetical protein [Methylomarinum sp. Ch1-1]MDP4522583.1 hypothetical protein [Methylomarinum sp. Ch1-1]
MVSLPMKTNKPFARCAALLSNMAKVASPLNKQATAAKYANGLVGSIPPQTLYLFYPTGWREATEGLSPERAAKALMAAGYLVPDGNRPQRKVSLPDNTHPRMYCVKGSILDD